MQLYLLINTGIILSIINMPLNVAKLVTSISGYTINNQTNIERKQIRSN